MYSLVTNACLCFFKKQKKWGRQHGILFIREVVKKQVIILGSLFLELALKKNESIELPKEEKTSVPHSSLFQTYTRLNYTDV